MNSDNGKNQTNIFYPRPGSVEYNLLMADKETKQKIINRFKFINKYFIIPLYRIGLLPLFGFGFIFLLLFTKGHKTGKQRITPVEYQKINNTIHIFASRGKKTHWLKNMKANPEDVKIRKGFRKFSIEFETVPLLEREELFREYVKTRPRAAKSLLGWNKKEDNPQTIDFSYLAENIVILRLYKV